MHPDDEARFVDYLREAISIDLQLIQDDIYIGGLSQENDSPPPGAVQLLRSKLAGDVMTQGRVALATTGFGLEDYLPADVVSQSEDRYKRMRSYIRSTYHNGVLRWINIKLPRSKTNPGKPDPQTWVGPEALRWWKSSTSHRLKQEGVANLEAEPVD